MLGAFVGGTAGNGPTLADGAQLFAAARRNLEPAPSTFAGTPGFSTGRAALGKMKSPAGTSLNLAVRAVLCGPDSVTGIEGVLAGPAPEQATPIRVISDSKIGAAWYLLTDLPPMIHVTLGGAPPSLTPLQNLWTAGVSLRLRHDFGCGAVEPRGVWRIPGV